MEWQIKNICRPQDSIIRQVLLTMVSALICISVFPPLNLWPMAWIGLIPFFIAVSGSSLKGSFFLGWMFGTIKSMGIVYWIFYAVYVHGSAGVLVSLLFFILATAGFLAFYYAFFSLGAGKVFNMSISPWMKILLIPCLWVAIEFIRSRLFSGFPWALIGHSQYGWTSLIQASDITGVYGLSFLIVLSNVSLTMIFLQWKQSRSSILFAAPVLLTITAVLIYGHARIHYFDSLAGNAAPEPIGVIQSSIPQRAKWDQNKRKNHLRELCNLSEQALSKGARVVVWPETAVTWYMRKNIPKQLRPLLKRPRATLIVGAPSYQKTGERLVFHNAAYQISGDKIVNQYHKRHLLPFSEYFPFRKIDFLKFRYFGSREYSAGKKNVILDTPSGRLGMLICFEVLFPELARQAVQDGAQFLVNISNESWFGKSGEHFQHFNMAAFRAVEFRRPLLRSGNTGISGFIDCVGRELNSLPPFQQGFLIHTPECVDEKTFYFLYGDMFAFLCLAVMLSFVLSLLLKRIFRKS